VLLRHAERYGAEGTDKIIWEHGRRTMELQADGLMPIVCPVRDETDLAGICVFVDGLADVRKIMDGDPAVRAGVLSYRAHPRQSFPGSALPAR
jgi:hypothetical protein